jgi:hypothetical protein
MAQLFHRQYRPAPWNPDALEGPLKGLTLREWEVSVLLCSLPPTLKRALHAPLLASTAPRWPTPPAAEPDPAADPRDHFWHAVTAARQTLDTPFGTLHGIARDMRLVAQGRRLRQAAAALGESGVLQDMEGAQRPASPPPPPDASALCARRWGGRWAVYFASAPRRL